MYKARILGFFNNGFLELTLAAGVLFFPQTVFGQNEIQGQTQERPALKEFISLAEWTTDGKILPIPPNSFRSIIDKKSRLRISFKKDHMYQRLALDKRIQELEKLKKDNADRGVQDELRTYKITQFLLNAEKFEVSVIASIIPKSGVEYDLPVEGFTTVINTEGEKKRTKTTTLERRLYRIDLDVDSNNLKIVDSLPDTIIDIPYAKVSDGDRLVVTITNYSGISARSEVWEFDIEDVGIYTKQDATLLLVKRLGQANEPEDLDTDFKPAPGSSFVFKYKSRSKWWNFVDPAVGINGSFLDFRSDKNLEIGVGFVISFFNGLLQVNYGWNLHVKSYSQYWSIGLGFLDISDKIKGLKKD